ncbi:rCG29069 [Rattus norvegicus]|uniref:RCG29069 n=1 Tax=Rattus norvegicus TaxID=10116 RepID=A6HVX2_RAT|nr:rCG29069 [Rattus norvegicus]
MSQLGFNIYLNPKEVGSNASEGMDFPETGSRQKSFLPPCPLYRLPAESVAQIKGGSYYFKISGLKIGFPTSNYLIKKKIPSQVYPAAWVLVNFRYSPTGNQEIAITQ